MTLGLIARSDCGGLGHQTRNLARLLKPDRVMLIDSTPFNGAAQHPEWYASYDYTVVSGFPGDEQCRAFLDGLTHVLTAETAYNPNFWALCREMNVISYLQYNHEFLDHLADPRLTTPHYFLSPSHWYLDDMKRRAPGRVVYLPPPTCQADHAAVREANFARDGQRRRFLHIVGNRAVHDRNGTETLLKAVRLAKADFELVITSQNPLDVDAGDDRVHLDYSAPQNNAELYRGFDALILPRRYGGLCLPMNEALMSGLPVIMTRVSPNDHVLPVTWTVPAVHAGAFLARTKIELYDAEVPALAAKLDWLARLSDREMGDQRVKAFELGYRTYSPESLRERYEQVLAR